MGCSRQGWKRLQWDASLPMCHFYGTLSSMTKKDCIIDVGTAFTVE
jgi:hypothetical protein